MRKFLRDAAGVGNLAEVFTPVNVGISIVLFIPLLYLIAIRRQLPPGPIAIPFIGHIHIFGNGQFMYRKLMLLRKKYGNIIRIQLGGTNTIVVHGHDLIREALVVKGDRFRCRPDWIKGFGNHFGNKGFGWSNGEGWQRMHNLAVSSVKELVTEKSYMEDLVQEEAQLLANELFVQKSNALDIKDVIYRSMFHILYGFAFTQRFDLESTEGRDLMTALQTVCKVSSIEYIQRGGISSKMYPKSISNESHLTSLNKLKTILRGTLSKQKETHIPSRTRHLTDCCLSYKSENKDKTMEDEEILQAMVDIFTIGLEPLVNTLLWTFLYMIKYPEIQTMCRAEMNKVAKPPSALNCCDEDKVPFVTATIREVQRICNVLPLGVPHSVTEDTQLGGYKIPKGYVLLFHLYSSHMDHSYWTRPQEFRPEHFLDSNSKLSKHDTFFPFGVGARSCPFSSLAWKILFVFFTNTLRRFQLKVPDGCSAPSIEAEDNVCRCPKPFKLCAVPLE